MKNSGPKLFSHNNRRNHSSQKNEFSNLSPKDRFLRKFLEYGIIGLLIFSPLPIASVEEWAVLVIQLTVLLLMGAFFLLSEKPKRNTIESNTLRRPALLFTVFFIYLFFQILPLPVFIVKILSPAAYAFKSEYSYGLFQGRFMSLSVAPFHTLREGLELLTYVFLGFLVIKTVTRSRQINKILYILIGMGVFEAVYGIFELFRKHPRLLFYKKDINLDFVTGTFVNQNHLTGYLEMIIPLTIGLIIVRIDSLQLTHSKWREKIVYFAENGLVGNLILLGSAIVMSIAVVLSKNRSGFFLVFFSFILFFELTILYFRRLPFIREGIKFILKGIFIFITIIVLYVGVGATLSRFSPDRLFQGDRTQYWSTLSGVIKDFPLFGTGLGTFAAVYPAYESERTYGLLFHAHNDYLEYFSELGIIGSALFFGALILLFLTSFNAWKERRNPYMKGLGLGTIVALIVISAHSLTDFNLHIPANMLLYSVLMGLTYVIAFHRKSVGLKNLPGTAIQQKVRKYFNDIKK